MGQRRWIPPDAAPGVPPASPPSSFAVSRSATAGEVFLRGELDAYTAPRLDEVLAEEAGKGRAERIVVDLGQLEFIDVTGMGALVSAHNGAHRSGKELVLRSPTRQTLKLLEITGLNRVFTIEEG